MTIKSRTDEGMKGATALASWAKDPSQGVLPFNIGNNVETDIFTWYEQDEYRGRRFAAAMTGFGKVALPDSIFVRGQSPGLCQTDGQYLNYIRV